jgi:hypothetical protein
MSDTHFDWKQAVVAALVACVFTIVAGVITYYATTREPDLKYSIASGPTLSSSGEERQIFLLRVRNTGRKEVESVSVQVGAGRGRIVDYVVQSSLGLELSQQADSSRRQITVPVLNPGDSVVVSFLYAARSTGGEPIVAVRGKGLIGELDSTESNPRRVFSTALLVGALAASLGVLTSLATVTRQILGWSTRSLGDADDRKDVIAYVLAQAGFVDEAKKLWLSDIDPTYRSIADLVVSTATAEPARRSQCLLAAKGLLLYPNVTDASRDVIARAARVLGARDDEIGELRGRLEKSATAIEVRDAIDSVVTSRSQS